MNLGEKVVVAMSGGVDSSVAALLLSQAGFSVIGLSMRLYACPAENTRSCCTASDRQDARAVCEHLGIPHLTVDATDRFNHFVIEPFIEAYISGKTPSPCIACNEFVKFPVLLEYCASLGARWIATGHYARVVRASVPSLLRGKDRDKDQSYFLYSIGLQALQKLLLPIGELTKQQVRALAREHGLLVSEKPDSQEVCFVRPEGRIPFIEARAGDRLPGRGLFVDLQGHVLGTHRGFHAFTVGQRKGLGLGGGPRRYVVRINPKENTVILGSEQELLQTDFFVTRLRLLDPELQAPTQRRRALVQIRSRHRAAPATLFFQGKDRVLVRFDQPQSAICPGQAAVFYDADRVLGGGIIEQP